MASLSQIEKEALNLLRKSGITQPAVDVESIIKQSDIILKADDFGSDISGLLLFEDNKVIIGYNNTESEVRRRFTQAHELGHFILHSNKSELFVDKQKVLFRDGNSSSGDYKIEREANAFAASLLMPKQFITACIHEYYNLPDDIIIEKLAKKFNVSEIAMTFRLINLKLISPAVI